MALTFKGFADQNSNSVAIPTHAVGDLIIMFAVRSSTTQSSKPAPGGTVPAWVDIDAAVGSHNISIRSAYFVATATNTTSGTWTNADDVCVVVISGQATSPIGGHGVTTTASSTTANAPAVTMSNTDGTSLLLEVFGQASSGLNGWGASAPAGYTRQGSGVGFCCDTKNVTTSDGATTHTFGVAVDNCGTTIEILAATSSVTVTPTGASLTVSGGTPVVSTPLLATPTGASLTVTGGIPVVSTPRLVTPSGAALAITGGTPVVSTPRLITPSAAALTITGGSPVVAEPVVVAPTGASLAITGGTPAISSSILVTPGPVTLSLTGGIPGIVSPVTLTPGGAALAITGGAPHVTTAGPITITPVPALVKMVGHHPTITGITAPQAPVGGGTPAWAQSVSAFTAASQSSRVLNASQQLQFPDTSQLGGLCGNLVGGSAFTSGLVDNGDQSQGTAGALVTGSQGFADSFCGLMGGSGTDTTPQSVLDGANDVNHAVNANPMASGTIAMGQPFGPSGNSALDAINGVQNLANNLYGILSGCGCGVQNDPSNVSPQQVIDTTQQTADGVQNSPMAMGLIGMGQTDGGSGNVALDAINGSTAFANSLFEILQGCGCGGMNSPQQATPEAVINTAQQTADAVNSNPMASGMIAIGQQDGGSGNVAVDAINGTQTFANSLFNILSICGCGAQESRLSGFLLPRTDALNPYAPPNVTPDIVLSAAQAVADEVSANPLASNVIASGLPHSSGNLGVAVVKGITAAATAFQDDVSAASTLGQTNAQAISLQAINNANYHAIDRTLNAVFNIHDVRGADTITVTEDASTIGFITITTTTTKTFAVFVGYVTGTITSAFLNVYAVDTAAQTLTLASSSLDIASDLSTKLDWIYAELQTDIPVTQGQIYGAELAVAGSGTVTLIGMPNHPLPPNGNVYPGQLAALRSTDVFDSSVVWAGTGSVTSGSWTHVVGALASAIFVTVNAVGGGGSPTASVGGHAMTLLRDFAYTGGHLYVWVLYSPTLTSGSQAVSFTGLTSSLVSASSVAFNGVTAAGTPVTASGTGTALSHSATGTVGGLLFQAFGYSAGVGTITGYNQTLAAYEPGASGNDDPLAVGYAVATGSSQTFTATGSISDPWGSVVIPLTATIPTITAPTVITAPAYSPNVPWLALSSVLPPPLVLAPGTATQTLTPGSPVVTYPGSPTLFMLVDKTSTATHTISNSYGLIEYTGTALAAWTLPSIAANNGLVLYLYNAGTAAVTVTCSGADQFYRPTGSTTTTLPPNASKTLVSDGIYWLSI